ncbi:MAG: flagellar hook-associated protein FlgK [Spirochaetaceae bacterium]
MQSTFSGIEIGKRGLFAHNRALTTTGHNLTNGNTEGYSRQRVVMESFHPISRPGLTRAERPGQLGQGVEVARIERVRDLILEGRIVSQAGGETYWNERDSYMLQIEQVYNEPTDSSMRTLLDRFWDGWQELSMHPDQIAPREALLERGQALLDGASQRFQQLDRIGSMLEDEVQTGVNRINDLTREIADLNREITRVEAAGDNPNDLYDRRDLLVERLSGIIDISVDRRDPTEFRVNTAGYHLVQGDIAMRMSTEPDRDNQGYSQVVWEHSGEEIQFQSGSLAAHLELRDVDIRNEIQSLDTFVMNFADAVNEIHRNAFGLNGRTGQDFFVEQPIIDNTIGNFDRNEDGAVDSTYLFRMHGANRLNPDDQIGLSGTMTLSGSEGPIEVTYGPGDTVQDVVRRINNSGAEVVARLDRDQRLSLKATTAANRENPDFVIRQVEDSGQFLVGYAGVLQESGADGAFRSDESNGVDQLRTDGGFAVAPRANPSAWIAINPALEREPASIASSISRGGRDGEPGDGAAAEQVALLRHEALMLGGISTFEDYFADSVASVGLRGEQARESLRTHELIMKDLRDHRDSISGVNMDEELSQMIMFQHGYSAAARYLTEVDNMLDTIINRMGV